MNNLGFNLNNYIFLIVMSFSFALKAETPDLVESTKPSTNLKSLAQAEATTSDNDQVASRNINSSKSKTNLLPLAQVQEPLQLKDTFLQESRENLWKVGLFIEAFAPQGRGEILNTSQYDLNLAAQTYMPSLRFGREFFKFNTSNNKWTFQPLFSGDIGYVSQELNLTTPTGSRIEGRLNSIKTNINADLILTTPMSERLKPKLGFLYGRLFSSYATNTSIARWSESVDFSGYSAGLIYDVSQNWETQIQWVNRTNIQETQSLEVQASSTEIGLQYKW